MPPLNVAFPIKFEVPATSRLVPTYKLSSTYKSPPVVVIPPAEARVVIPTDLNVEFAVTPFYMSTAALISKLEENVETPATFRFPPIFTALPIPIPPSTTKAPLVGDED